MIKKGRDNMGVKTYIDTEKVNEVISNLESILNKLTNTFDNQDRNLLDVGETPTWTGKSASVLRSKYDQLSKNFPMVVYSLELYIRFLRKTVEDYELMNKAQSENIDEMKEQLDVNA
jgi:hypothetical protein